MAVIPKKPIKRYSSGCSGFTLIELMIVVAIIGVLSAILAPKVSDLYTRSKESTAKGSLATLRSCVSIYYADNEGYFPLNLNIGLTTNGRYLDSVPIVSIPAVTAQNNPGHVNVGSIIQGASADGTLGGGSSIWFYGNTGSANGTVIINCSHSDSKGTIWTAY